MLLAVCLNIIETFTEQNTGEKKRKTIKAKRVKRQKKRLIHKWNRRRKYLLSIFIERWFFRFLFVVIIISKRADFVELAFEMVPWFGWLSPQLFTIKRISKTKQKHE